MIRKSIPLIGIFCFLLAFPVLAEPLFFSSIRDVPVMPALTELPDQTVVFDKAEGRIIESIAEIHDATNQQILEYYASTLPQLGWIAENPQSYTRETERLRLQFEKLDKHRFLRLMIAPL
jgi:hypothetical protein